MTIEREIFQDSPHRRNKREAGVQNQASSEYIIRGYDVSTEVASIKRLQTQLP